MLVLKLKANGLLVIGITCYLGKRHTNGGEFPMRAHSYAPLTAMCRTPAPENVLQGTPEVVVHDRKDDEIEPASAYHQHPAEERYSRGHRLVDLYREPLAGWFGWGWW